jgi:hypothetical protein
MTAKAANAKTAMIIPIRDIRLSLEDVRLYHVADKDAREVRPRSQKGTGAEETIGTSDCQPKS